MTESTPQNNNNNNRQLDTGNLLNSMAGNMVDSNIMTEFISIVNGFNCSDYKRVISYIVFSSVKISLLISTKYVLSNNPEFVALCKSFSWYLLSRLFFTSRKYKIGDIKQKEYWIVKGIEKEESGKSINLCPITSSMLISSSIWLIVSKVTKHCWS